MGLGLITALGEECSVVADYQGLIKTTEKDILESNLAVQSHLLTWPCASKFVILIWEMGFLLTLQDYYESLMK